MTYNLNVFYRRDAIAVSIQAVANDHHHRSLNYSLVPVHGLSYADIERWAVNRCFDDDVQNSVKPFGFAEAAMAVADGDDDDDGGGVGVAAVAVAVAVDDDAWPVVAMGYILIASNLNLLLL